MGKHMSVKEKQILKRNSELKYPTDRLSAGSLMTQESHTNSSRLIMTNHQLADFLNIKDPEAPLVPTGFENVLASYSSMNHKTDGDYTIVAKFVKNKYNYVLIGYDKKRKHYHAWKRVEVEEHSEGFCTKYNNSTIDGLDIGDTIDENEYIIKSSSFDKNMNYCFGKNLNVVYMVSAQDLEDGIIVMNGAENKMDAYRATTQIINLADNEVLLNWYGDEDHYQGIPRIGEKTKKGILAVVRRVDNAKAPYALKSKRLRNIERGDIRRYGNGRVIDIDILYNKELKDISESGANKLLKEMYEAQQKYYKSLYKYMIDIVNHAYEGEYTYSDEFTIICEEARKYIDATVCFADSNENIFGNMQIIVHLMDEEKLIVGSKLVGRYGDKGVISAIYPPEKSWHMEDGTPIDLVVATLGIVGRLNQSQLNEHSINELSHTAVNMMKLTEDVDQKGKIVYKLMKYLNSDEAESFKEYFKGLSDDKKVKVCKQIERDGIYIVQDPIDNADMFQIGKAYKDFPANYQHIVFPDGRKSMHRVLCAKRFYMRLKQDPVDKYSARSRGPVNPLTTLPAKSNLKKKGYEPFSDVPVRIGEYEIEVLLAMVNHPAGIAAFMVQNSTSWEAKMRMAERDYLMDITDEEDLPMMEDLNIGGKKNLEAIAAYNNVLGAKIEMDIEEAPDGEYLED